jgi:FkbM family methyltransferase
MPLPLDEKLHSLGSRLEGLGRVLGQPGRLRRKLTGAHLDEEFLALAQRPYLHGGAIRTVLDVGANEGQFARTALVAFPAAKIHCFEPLPGAHQPLRELGVQSAGRVELEPWALGDHEGQVQFHVNAFSPSSSVLALDQDVSALGSQVRVASTVEVPVRRLTDWAAPKSLETAVLLKLDVQGYEASVLRGAQGFLERIFAVVAETTFAPIYKGQATLGDLCSILEPVGLRYREAFGVIRDPTSGEPLWQDSVFVRDR